MHVSRDGENDIDNDLVTLMLTPCLLQTTEA